jgi:hypothetical protein
MNAPFLKAELPAGQRQPQVLDALVFGDNQFFGVNHASEAKAREQLMRFSKLEAIIEVLDAAYDEGIRAFMCTTHERIAEICDHVRANPARYAGFKFYPSMPYAHKYANAVTDLGMMGAMQKFLPQDNLLGTMLRGVTSVATRDVGGMATLLVDAEMKMFRGLETPVIFLQNVVVDLLLGLNATPLLRAFADHVRETYDAEPGFITMNLPRLLPMLEAAGVQRPVVCANINKAGFRMSGGIDAYTEALRNSDAQVMAMSVFASGAIPAEEAIAWIATVPNVQSVVFGASSRTNIHRTSELAARYLA